MTTIQTAAAPEGSPAVATLDEAIFLGKRQAAEDSLRNFVEQAWDVLEPGTKFIPGVHFDAVCLHLQAMIECPIKDLLINIPPGFAKSMIGAVFMPAWVWIKDPGYRFLFSTRWIVLGVGQLSQAGSFLPSTEGSGLWKDQAYTRRGAFDTLTSLGMEQMKIAQMKIALVTEAI